jgi:hypothetical protein
MALPLLAIIGLDDPLAQRVKDAVGGRVVVYPDAPASFAIDGRLRLESATVAGRWLDPDGVVFYSYIEGAADLRRAIASSETPSFPDVRSTIGLDDKFLALIAALRAGARPIPRGFVPGGHVVNFEGLRVFKWGNRHCGDDKVKVDGTFVPSQGAIIEPFLEGESDRVLIVGEREWQLRYESGDWRKNVGGTVRVLPDANAGLVAHARAICQRLDLKVAGLDFIVAPSGSFLLEVNAYPGLEDVPGAEGAFIEELSAWWNQVAASASAVR